MSRTRLTITLKQDILNLLDKTIDNTSIRNRSHAIEFILNKALLPQTSKVVILTGSQTASLKSRKQEIPSAMISVAGKPLLESTINKLRGFGLRDIIIVIDEFGKYIKDHFKNGKNFGVKIFYKKQTNKDIGSAGALKLCASQFKEKEAFLLIYGDVLAEIDYFDLLDFHQKQGNSATVALTTIDNPTIWGTVKMQGMQVTEFKEKPKKKKELSHLISTGIFVLDSNIFNLIPKKEKVSFEREVLSKLAEKSKLSGYIFDGHWRDLGI